MRPAAQAAEQFQRLHGRAPTGVWSSPGRVNLIGEHTDYNDGLVLPFALPYRISVAAAARPDGLLTIASIGSDGQPQRAEPVTVSALEPGSVTGWPAYPSGVCWVLRDEGWLRPDPERAPGGQDPVAPDRMPAGADLVITGDVPAGAGLSSSHALQCATALALLGLAGAELDTAGAPTRQRIAAWVQRSENEFAGVPSGLLDQTASLCCVAAHALFLDVRSGRQEQIPFDAPAHGLQVLVIDTRARHSHAESGYRDRRRGCAEAAARLGVSSLRDVSPADLPSLDLPPDLLRLVRHVVTENARVQSVVDLLRSGRLTDIGPLLTESHTSLAGDYRVTSPELDEAVAAALAGGALGARMTGGGFGGSAIALVHSDRIPAITAAVTAAFARRSFPTPRLFTAAPSAGASRDL